MFTKGLTFCKHPVLWNTEIPKQCQNIDAYKEKQKQNPNNCYTLYNNEGRTMKDRIRNDFFYAEVVEIQIC
jgi:hypothetical protein